MRELRSISLIISLIVLLSTISLSGQNEPFSKNVFLNAPLLFRTGGKSFHHAVASYHSEKAGKTAFFPKGKVLHKADPDKDDNRILLTFQAVTRPAKVVLAVKIDHSPKEKSPFALITPPKKWQIYFVQYFHTDIGYTRPQSKTFAEHMRYNDNALDYCDQTDQLPDDANFQWTCESAWYLLLRPFSPIVQFNKRIAEGRIEGPGMYCNMAEIFDQNVMYDFLQPLKEFNKLGISSKIAMSDHVNGIAWCMSDYSENTGVKYLEMGINKTRSILPFVFPFALTIPSLYFV